MKTSNTSRMGATSKAIGTARSAAKIVNRDDLSAGGAQPKLLENEMEGAKVLSPALANIMDEPIHYSHPRWGINE
jgi:hypothetical protein